MDLEELNNNQKYKSILTAIVHEYIKTGKPVGSRSIAKKMGFKWSPATIRNIMADLEEMEYIYQPHTSAGRVPTDKGYRFYVGALMEVKALTLRERKRIEEEFNEKISEIDKVLRITSQLLALSSKKIGMITEPLIPQSRLEFIGIGKLGNKRAILTIATDSGVVRNKIFYCSKEYSMDDLLLIQKILNYELRGLNFLEIQNKLKAGFYAKYVRDLASDEFIEDIVTFAIGVLHSKEEFPEVYFEGTKNYLMYVDNAEDMQGILSMIDDKQKYEDVFLSCLENEGVNVLIGREIKHKDLQNCSIITSTYRIGDRNIGSLGIIGPKRMEYPKMMALVSFVADVVSNILSHFGGDHK